MKLGFQLTKGRNDQTLKEYLTDRGYCKKGGLYEDVIDQFITAPKVIITCDDAPIVVALPPMMLAAQPGLPPSVVAPTQATPNEGDVQNM